MQGGNWQLCYQYHRKKPVTTKEKCLWLHEKMNFSMVKLCFVLRISLSKNIVRISTWPSVCSCRLHQENHGRSHWSLQWTVLSGMCCWMQRRYCTSCCCLAWGPGGAWDGSFYSQGICLHTLFYIDLIVFSLDIFVLLLCFELYLPGLLKKIEFAVMFQSNCQVCEVDKDRLDDDECHAPRFKHLASSQVCKAAQEGIFPGFREEAGYKGEPRPIFSAGGNPRRIAFNLERLKLAEKNLGLKLVPNSTWLFPHFDCYVQVRASMLF